MRLNDNPYKGKTGIQFEYKQNSGTIIKLVSPKMTKIYNKPIR